MFYYPIVVAVLTLLSQGNLTHVTVLTFLGMQIGSYIYLQSMFFPKDKRPHLKNKHKLFLKL
jgi:hypothetical protein